MWNEVRYWIIVVLLSGGYVHAATQEPVSPAPSPSGTYRTVVSRYCLACHNEKLKTAGLSLEGLDTENVHAGAAVWEKVIRKLRARQMPPAGMPRPDDATYKSFSAYLETAIDRSSEATPNPGRPPGVRRLNRTEYVNAIRDLLAIDVDGRSLLPADDAAYGFDNIGDALTISPVLLERYMSAAEKISRLAVGDKTLQPAVDTYEVPRLLKQDDRIGEDLPFGSRGGLAVRHYFPLDGEYVVKVRLQRDALGDIVDISEPKQVDLRLDGNRVKLFAVGGERNLKFQDPGQDYARTGDAGLEATFSVKAGSRLITVAFLKDTLKPEGAQRELGRRDAYEGLGSVRSEERRVGKECRL